MKEGFAIKKPIPVRFVQWEGQYGEPEQVKRPGPECAYFLPSPQLLNIGIISTLEGDLLIREGDYVVGPGAGGEYWPIRRDIFEATYDVSSTDNQRGSTVMKAKGGTSVAIDRLKQAALNMLDCDDLTAAMRLEAEKINEHADKLEEIILDTVGSKT